MIRPPQLQLTDYRHHRNATVDSIDAAIPTIREWFTNESNGTRYYMNTVLDHLEHGAINPGMLRNELFIGVHIVASDTVRSE